MRAPALTQQLVTAAFLIAILVASAWADSQPGPAKVDRYDYRDYQLRIFKNGDNSAGFEVWRGAQRLEHVEAEDGHTLFMGVVAETGWDNVTYVPVPMGKDVTGDGEPDLVVSEWTGGAHCCYQYYIYQLGPRFRRLAKIDAGHSGASAGFRDVDGDGKLEFVLRDWTFAYWKEGYAGSPAPEVILQYRNGGYRVATELMRKPAPATSEMQQEVRRLNQKQDAWDRPEPPSDLWRYMLDLLYSGHEDLAWQFLDMAWPATRPGKERFTDEFKQQLTKSPYWRELKGAAK